MERQFRINWQALVEEAKFRRKKLKLTQTTLATLANISTPSVSHFENGKKDIQLSTALAILQALGMTEQRTLLFSHPNIYFHPETEVVVFNGHDGKTLVTCGISLIALEDHFDPNAKRHPMQTFKTYQTQILYLAKKKYLQGKLEQNGTILVKTEDV